MSNAETKKEKQTSKIFRKQHGAVSKILIARDRENRQIRKKLTAVLKNGPGTVPEISKETGIPSSDVLWHLMSMRKYGIIVDGEECDSYIRYMLKGEKGK